MPLSLMSPGSYGRIRSVLGGKCLNQRLSAMGMVKDSEVEVMEGDGRCSIVRVNGSRYAIGRGMASRIMVDEDV